MATRRVVFVADDLGISPGVNAGIAAAARAGIVREASLCVTGHAVVEGVQIARELGIGIGLHLSLTLGKALTGPIRGLTDVDGNFGRLGPALLRTHLHRVDRVALAREVTAQVERLHELGIAPTHANGHHHSHCWPIVRDLAAAAFARAGVQWSRLPAEHGGAEARLRPLPLVLGFLAARSRRALRSAGLRALPFVGSTLETRLDHAPRFLRALERLPAGATEWMVHPRQPDAVFAALDQSGTALDAAARAELATLLSPTTFEALDQLGIASCRFADLEPTENSAC
jgi:chitin disaccharide deacetylase